MKRIITQLYVADCYVSIQGEKEIAEGVVKEKHLFEVTIGEPRQLNGPITLAEYDPTWPSLFEREALRIRVALVDRALNIQHVGSTAVPELASKPIIDILLVLADTADETAYVPALEAAG